MEAPDSRYEHTGCIRCGDCCEAFLMNDDLVESHRPYFQRTVVSEKHLPHIGQTLVLTEDGRCVFLLPDNTCSIYEDRPEFPCRIFGIPGWLECPTVAPDGRLRTPDERDRILERNSDRDQWSDEFRKYFNDHAAACVEKLMKQPGPGTGIPEILPHAPAQG